MTYLVLVFCYVLNRKLEVSFSPLLLAVNQGLESFLGRLFQEREKLKLFLQLAVFGGASVAISLLLESQLYGLMTLLFELLILLLCLGGSQFRMDLERYLNAWRRADFEAAVIYSRPLCLPTITRNDEADRVELHHRVCEGVLYYTFERYFMVIFWFMAVGPVGAVIARIVSDVAMRKGAHHPAFKLLHLIEWLPVRLVVITFAFAGDFVGGMRKSISGLIEPFQSTCSLLDMGAGGALDSYSVDAQLTLADDEETVVSQGVSGLTAIRDLINRSVLVWLAALAVITVAGWSF